MTSSVLVVTEQIYKHILTQASSGCFFFCGISDQLYCEAEGWLRSHCDSCLPAEG